MNIVQRFTILLSLTLLQWLPAVAADEIAIDLSDGNRGLAIYHSGETEKPAVFILHGFLQTSRFSTIQLITEELIDNGYTVLAPTLTLNIDQRRNGLSCNAIQNHSISDSNREIEDWLRWLKSQGHQQIIAIGHSSGSMRLLSYISEPSQPLIDFFVPTAIGPIAKWQNPEEVHQQIEMARQRIANQQRSIDNYTLAFCSNNYAAPAKAYLSYMLWTEEWLLEKLGQSTVPLHLIIGGNDNWLPPDWNLTLKASGLPFTQIEDASHNFTGPQEFDFLDALNGLLDEVSSRSP